MQPVKTSDNYPLALGEIAANLRGLELLLRFFLDKVDSKRYGSPPPIVEPGKIKKGDVVPENYFTNWDTLGELVKKYNSLVTSQKAPELCVDETVVMLRDALAHGRVLGRQPTPPHQLYKFGKPKNGQVTVEDVADLTESELAMYNSRVSEQIAQVIEACERFCPSVFG